MKILKQGKIQKIISIILVVFWASLIFLFSNQGGTSSTNNSNFIVDFLNNFLNLFIDIDLTNYDFIFLLVRKLAHLLEYFILAILVYYLLYQFKVKKKLILTIIICFLYALSDEFHQLFIIGREGRLIDVLIDTLGASLICLFKTKLANSNKL